MNSLETVKRCSNCTHSKANIYTDKSGEQVTSYLCFYPMSGGMRLARFALRCVMNHHESWERKADEIVR